MASKHYVVWVGRVPGIYKSWADCKEQTDKFPAAKFKSFKTEAEAESAFFGKTLAKEASKLSSPQKKQAKKKSPKNILKTYTAVEIDALPAITKIFTDGACVPNPGEAGSGIALYRNNTLVELWYGLYEPTGTNNTAELNALHQALIIAAQEVSQGRSVAVLCDSKYSIQSVTQWAVGWEKKGWTKKGGEIKNLDIIKLMFKLYQSVASSISVLHVNGHVGVEGNELADRMSMVAIETGEFEFARYVDDIDVGALLALRAG